MNRSMGMAEAMVGVVDEEGVVVSAFLIIWGRWFPLGFPGAWVDRHSLALCPFLQQWKQSPSQMHRARSAGESFLRRIVSMSMASGSLVTEEPEVKEESGKPCPFLRARMQAFCRWKSMALPIQALSVSGTFSIEYIMVEIWGSSPLANSLRTSGVSPAWDCSAKYWNLERYVWKPSFFRVGVCLRSLSSSLAVSSRW